MLCGQCYLIITVTGQKHKSGNTLFSLIKDGIMILLQHEWTFKLKLSILNVSVGLPFMQFLANDAWYENGM